MKGARGPSRLKDGAWEYGQVLGMKIDDPIGGVTPMGLIGLLRLEMEGDWVEKPERKRPLERERPPVLT